jgi:hypothetical protein
MICAISRAGKPTMSVITRSGRFCRKEVLNVVKTGPYRGNASTLKVSQSYSDESEREREREREERGEERRREEKRGEERRREEKRGEERRRSEGKILPQYQWDFGTCEQLILLILIC